MRVSRSRAVIVALGLSAGPVWAQAPAAQVASPRAPSWPAERWETSSPEAEGIDPAAIAALVADIEAGVYGLVDHFLLIRHGRVVADHRFTHDYRTIAAAYDTAAHQYNYDHPDWHPWYRGTDLHTLQSVTKSVTSAALGIAIDEGLIPDVDVKVLPYFAGYGRDTADARWRALALRDLLTMRTGIAWKTDAAYGTGEHTTDLLEASERWIQFILDQPMDTVPGVVYEYNDGSSVLIGKLLGLATGKRADLWTAERLFAPLGITDHHWKLTPDGEADTEGGLYLSPHDLARIGYLFLRGGDWNGRRILSERWVRESTSPIVADVQPDNGRPDPGYGYQWWVPEQADGRAVIFAGNGYGGQFVLVAPAYDVVAVFNGWNIHGGDVRSTYGVLRQRLLPAMRR